MSVVEVESGKKGSGRLSPSMAIELLAIPVLVIVGMGGYALWHHGATLDSVESSTLDWDGVWLAIWQHIKLTLVASAFVVVIAVPLGVLLTRPRLRKFSGGVVGFANIGQAAPSVGLLVLLFIWLPSWSGFWVAILGLSIYGILPVLANTIAGLNSVDQTLVEAGRGIGMSNSAVLLRVEVPLALPVIMAGIRTALVLIVGTATLATFINAGGLGTIITSGITLSRIRVVIAGAVLVALLALLIEWAGRVLELVTRPKGV